VASPAIILPLSDLPHHLGDFFDFHLEPSGVSLDENSFAFPLAGLLTIITFGFPFIGHLSVRMCIWCISVISLLHIILIIMDTNHAAEHVA
jgi:hypothetical protein